MAAVSQQGSRAGLITALVIFVVLFLVATVLFFTTNADKNVRDKQLADLQAKYKDVIKPTEMTDAEYQALQEIQRESGNRGRSMFDILKSQRDDMAKAINPNSPKATDALKNATDLTAVVNKGLADEGVTDVTIGAGGLANEMIRLRNAIIEKEKKLKEEQAKVVACSEELKKQIALYQKELETHRTTLESARTETKTAVEDTTKYRAGKDEQVAGLEKSIADTVEKDRKAMEDLNTQLSARQAQITDLQKKLDQAYAVLSRFKVGGTGEAAIRRADGTITNIGKNGLVYVNRGLGQQISQGMTFEVYDKNEGIPRMSANDESLPAGKASIEITRVSPGSSEARIIKQSPGSQLMAGDLIANLVYDPNVKFRFKVFGDFDIDQDGRATPQEAEVVKRLIAQWGGIVTDDLNVDTDFLVMGKEPVVPAIPPEQLKDDPIREFEQKKAIEAKELYEGAKNRALELHTPVLNQNRFLYFIGFFDQARK